MATNIEELKTQLASALARRDARNKELLEKTDPLRSTQDQLQRLIDEQTVLSDAFAMSNDADLKAALELRIKALEGAVATKRNELQIIELQTQIAKAEADITQMDTSGRPIEAAAATANIKMRC